MVPLKTQKAVDVGGVCGSDQISGFDAPPGGTAQLVPRPSGAKGGPTLLLGDREEITDGCCRPEQWNQSEPLEESHESALTGNFIPHFLK